MNDTLWEDFTKFITNACAAERTHIQSLGDGDELTPGPRNIIIASAHSFEDTQPIIRDFREVSGAKSTTNPLN